MPDPKEQEPDVDRQCDRDSDKVRDRIVAIIKDLPLNVKLVAVSKYASVNAIRGAYAAGIKDFGESRVQDAMQKQQELQGLKDLSWHFIGQIQSNKAKLVVQRFDWIHSLDRLGLAQQLNRLVAELGKSPKICLQVKMAADPNKAGWHEHELLADLVALQQCQNLNIVGLMTILPVGLDAKQAFDLFMKTANLAMQLRSQGWSNLQHLSMGMSGDYDIAIRAGATLIRVGTKIFT
jgi:PLP dependent protein